MWNIFLSYHYNVIKYNFVSQYKICTKEETCKKTLWNVRRIFLPTMLF